MLERLWKVVTLLPDLKLHVAVAKVADIEEPLPIGSVCVDLSRLGRDREWAVDSLSGDSAVGKPVGWIVGRLPLRWRSWWYVAFR